MMDLFFWVWVAVLATIAFTVKYVARMGKDFKARIRLANIMLGLAGAMAAAACVALVVVGPRYGLDRQGAVVTMPVVLAIFMLPTLLGWRDARVEAREDQKLEDRWG
jgi:membrane protein YdbS with pleckstrin-like domain